ncbi:MAG: hypothetical protein IT379_01740 [Deltaproteobacteria bacterium]|nr:hypothetical protein [Deltaproteobacteria bacterium]
MLRRSHFATALRALAKDCALGSLGLVVLGVVGALASGVERGAQAQPRTPDRDGAEPVALWAASRDAEAMVSTVRTALTRRSIGVRTLADLGAAPARADVPERVRAALAEAQSRYGGAELEASLGILDGLEREIDAIVAASDGVSTLARIALWKAACLAKLRRGDEARSYFALAIRLGATPDPRVLSPDVMALVPSQSELATIAGSIEIVSRPELARIELDGRGLDARAPTSAQAGAGLHLVVVHVPGHASAARIVPARGRVEVATAPLDGRARIESFARARDEGWLAPAAGPTAEPLLAALGAARVIEVGSEAGGDVAVLALRDARGELRERLQVDARDADAIDRGVGRLLGERPTTVRADRRPTRRPTRRRAVESTSVFERWWFWGAVGVVVAGAAITTAAVATGGEDTFRVIVATPR